MSTTRRVPKVYAKISDSRRLELIRLVEIFKVPVKRAAKQLTIKYSTARYIVKTYRFNESGPLRPMALDLSCYTHSILRNLPSYQDLQSAIDIFGDIATDQKGTFPAAKIEEAAFRREMAANFLRPQKLEPDLQKKQKINLEDNKLN